MIQNVSPDPENNELNSAVERVARMEKPFRAKQKLGKYRIERQLGQGGFAAVYRALDTVEGIRVALKIPFQRYTTDNLLDDFRREVRLAAGLSHPNILPLKNAEFIDGHFVIAFPLGEQTLADRLQKRLSLATALSFAEQMLSAVAHAHLHRIIHCDVKPENLILLPHNRLQLTDFGIAKVAMKTIRASGSGTVGYVAPEQAMGKPSFRSDVFSLGLVIYRMLAGTLPEWPYSWPPPGIQRLRKRVPAEFVDFIKRAIDLDPKRRYADAGQMLAAFRRLKPLIARFAAVKRGAQSGSSTKRKDWRAVRQQQFQRQFGSLLETRYTCRRCDGPVSEPMRACPWCGASRRIHLAETRFPCQCPRCRRGLKLDWAYCPWCYGPGFEPHSTRQFSDTRYEARCANAHCPRKVLMRFMSYCPWCRRKVRRPWKLPGSDEKCPGCHWGVLNAYWSHCPWCGKSLARK